MNKYLKLSLVAVLTVSSFGMILSCSESDDGGKNKVEILPNKSKFNPPSWLQGEWVLVDNPKEEHFKFDKDEIFIRVEKDGKSELMKLADYVAMGEIELIVKEFSESDSEYYRVEFFDKEVPKDEPLAIYDFSREKGRNLLYCPINTDKVKRHYELEICKELVRK